MRAATTQKETQDAILHFLNRILKNSSSVWIIDNGIMDNRIMDNGIIDNGIMDNGITDNGITDNGTRDVDISSAGKVTNGCKKIM